MKQLRNLHHKQLQLSRISHDDMYNLHEYFWIYPQDHNFPDLVCVIPTMLLIHERKFANTHRQDIPAICKAKYPLVIDREQAMKPNYQTWLFCDCSVPCVNPYFSRQNRSISFRSIPDFSNYLLATKCNALFWEIIISYRFYNYYWHNYRLPINGAFLQGVSSMFNYLLVVHPFFVTPHSG